MEKEAAVLQCNTTRRNLVRRICCCSYCCCSCWWTCNCVFIDWVVCPVFLLFFYCSVLFYCLQDDYRRNQAFAQVLALKMRKRCWQNNDKGKIIDFEQGQKKFTRASSPVGKRSTSSTRKARKHHPKKLVLAELVPRDTFGFESVFQIEKTTEMNLLTGTIGHPVNRVSLVAKTSVVLLFIPKRDFFLFTTYKTRKLMRTKLMNPQLGKVAPGLLLSLLFLNLWSVGCTCVQLGWFLFLSFSNHRSFHRIFFSNF